MAFRLVDSVLEGLRAKAGLEQAQRVAEQAEYEAIDRLYETNPNAGIDRAKKAGYLPAGATLTAVDYEGTSLPAVNIPGLPKPVILPQASRKEYYATQRQLVQLGARHGYKSEEIAQTGDERRKTNEAQAGHRAEQIAQTGEEQRKTAGVQAGYKAEQIAQTGEEQRATELVRQEGRVALAETKGVIASDAAAQKHEYRLGEIAATGVEQRATEQTRQVGRVQLTDRKAAIAAKQAKEKEAATERRDIRLYANAVGLVNAKGDMDSRLLDKKATLKERELIQRFANSVGLENARTMNKERMLTNNLVNAPSYNPLIGKKVDIPKLNVTAATESEVAIAMADLGELYDYGGLDEDDMQRVTIAQAIVEATHVLQAAHVAKKTPVTPSKIRADVINTISNSSAFWTKGGFFSSPVLNMGAVQQWVGEQTDAVLWKDAVTEARKMYPQYKGIPDSVVIQQLKDHLSQPEIPAND